MTTESTAPTSIDQITPKMQLQGVVTKIELYGALVDVGIGRPGLLHISQISENHVKNVADVLKEGDTVTVWVKELDRSKGRLSLTMLKPPAVEWNEIEENAVFTGTVVRLEKFGAFVDIGAERPGLVHVSELAAGYVSNPNEVVSVGEQIQVKVIGVNPHKKQIDLSVKALGQASSAAEVVEDDEDETVPTAMELALRRAMEASGFEFGSKQQSKEKRRKKSKVSGVHEDIFARTLKQHSAE